MNKNRVIVAMSGGVDSSVAAMLLKRQGYQVIGVTMRLWTVERDDLPQTNKRCCSVEDVDDARRVCQVIGAPHYFMNFEREFQKHVVDYFVQEYDRGRTPHPCLACNDSIKFDFLLRRATFLEADYIATGHYARIRRDDNGLRLLKGVDEKKDQSYVLYTLTQTEINRLLLPIGEYPKSEIRRLAAEAGLPVADKPDSQEICFIPDGDYRRFVGERTKPRPGNITDSSGSILGRHPGVHFFTIGQRRGLGVKSGDNKPMYVTKIDSDTNTVILGDEVDLFSSRLWASRVNFTSKERPEGPIEVTAKIRYNGTPSPATVVSHANSTEILFHLPQRAVTPGQPVVFYQDDVLIGGGIIELEQPAANVHNASVHPKTQLNGQGELLESIGKSK